MTLYRVTLTVEAASAAEAITNLALDSYGEFNKKFHTLYVEPQNKTNTTHHGF